MKKILTITALVGLSYSLSFAQRPLDTSGVVPGGNAYFLYGNQPPTNCSLTTKYSNLYYYINCSNNIAINGQAKGITTVDPMKVNTSGFAILATNQAPASDSNSLNYSGNFLGSAYFQVSISPSVKRSFYLYLAPGSPLNTQPVTIKSIPPTNTLQSITKGNCLVQPQPGAALVICNDGSTYPSLGPSLAYPSVRGFSSPGAGMPVYGICGGGHYLGSYMLAGYTTQYFFTCPL